MRNSEKKAQFIGGQHEIWFVAAVLIYLLIRIGRAVQNAWTLPLTPDAAGYKAIANSMTQLYDTGFREAVWIWFVKLSLLVFGNADTSLRLMGALLFIVAGCLFYFTLRTLSENRWVALLGLFIFSSSGILLEHFAMPTRDSLFLISVIGLSLFVFAEKKSFSDRTRVWGLTVCSVLALGSRSTIGSVLVVILLYAKLRLPRSSWKIVWLPVVACVVVMGPYFIYCANQFGDFYQSANQHVLHWRNIEFLLVKKTGCLGCPTLEEFEKNVYAGEPTSWFSYLFTLHSPKELILETLNGIYRVFLFNGPLLRSLGGVLNSTLYIFYLIGLILVLRSPARQILLMPLIVLNALFFMIHLDMDPRLITPASPFLIGIHSVGVIYSVSYLLKKIFEVLKIKFPFLLRFSQQ